MVISLREQKRFSLEKMSQKNISKVMISHFAKATANQIGHKGCCVEIHFLHDFFFNFLFFNYLQHLRN